MLKDLAKLCQQKKKHFHASSSTMTRDITGPTDLSRKSKPFPFPTRSSNGFCRHLQDWTAQIGHDSLPRCWRLNTRLGRHPQFRDGRRDASRRPRHFKIKLPVFERTQGCSKDVEFAIGNSTMKYTTIIGFLLGVLVTKISQNYNVLLFMFNGFLGHLRRCTGTGYWNQVQWNWFFYESSAK